MYRAAVAPTARLPPANKGLGARTFMAHHINDGDESHNREYDPLLEQCRALEQLIDLDGTAAPAGYAFLSPAEQALRNASGTDRPVECWGCVNLPAYHKNRFHRFYDCPNRGDPEVERNASINMKKTRQQWEIRRGLEQTGSTGTSPYGPRKREAVAMLTTTDILSDWHRLGFEDQASAKRVADALVIATCDIPPRRRKQLIREWTQADKPNTNEQDDDNTYGGYTFLSPATHVSGRPLRAAVAFQATIPCRLPLEISPTLPHCDIPIGGTEGQGKLKVAMDSCAGVNIGHLAFHRAMQNVFPELIASFKTMAEYGEDTVTIGGVEASSAGNLQLTHIIEYRTPFRHRGEPCTIAFGLSEKAAATAILSINFLRKTKALWSYDDTAPNVHLTIWNTTLRVQYEQPTRRNPPTPQARFRQEATAVYAASAAPHE